ncbi:SpoIIE family protein phosphatase [Streptomyces sp. TLI_105]|uniref:SpoIIE family protein phosphatase n=1 Tax=Streptomyces sp. TLI_105 TaxID=1881019 RepID=UPI0008942BCF|nr:SpoIIE family protein phosphatase [Streptomyces sp. TLI_105]SEB81193.1 PAS domain S-box-containing protein [Streptomyces sp. TLI_105]
MSELSNPPDAGPSRGGLSAGVAAADDAIMVLDDERRLVGWSREAEALFGYRPDEVLGRPADAILADADTGAGVFADGRRRGRTPDIRSVRHRDGHRVDVAVDCRRLSDGASGVAWLVRAMPARELRERTVDRAVTAGIYHQSPVLLTIYETDGRIRWFNHAVEAQFGVRVEECAGKFQKSLLPEGMLLYDEGREVQDVEEIIRRVARTGEPVIDMRYRSVTPLEPLREHVWTASYFVLNDEEGVPVGVCETGVDISERYVAQQRLALLSRAGASIGGTLDMRRTAGELGDLVVPEFADAVVVGLFASVLSGQDPPVPANGGKAGSELCEVARNARAAAVGDIAAAALDEAGPRCLADAAPVSDPASGALVVPLESRGVAMGVVAFVRSAPRDPFDAEEVALAEELASRTAVCVDNARRYAREHATALTLQQDLLPRALPRSAGVELAHRYLPAAGPVGVGGDWYDVIPLSGARVGFVVGDVAGHGMNAAATMGRLRTTVAALAALDLAPEELLARLDDLVIQAGAIRTADEEEDQAFGVTCLYAIYDPVSRRCVMARAGHPPPALVTPGGRAELLDLPAGPPLGLGGLPFESVEVEVPEGAVLVLYTDGLVESRDRDIDAGIRALCEAVSRPGRDPLEHLCDRVTAALLPRPPEDDAALLLIRMHALAEDQVSTWGIPADPGEVGRARSLVGERLERWEVDESASFIVELAVSELVTNAIRYGRPPIRLRLIRERGLIVEVSDGGHTSPHLRRAAMEDEGGRGLFLVAQLTQRWGTRYTPTGKTIWTELSLDPHELTPLAFGL